MGIRLGIGGLKIGQRSGTAAVPFDWSSYWKTQLGDALIAFFPLYEASGLVAEDIGSLGNDGAYRNSGVTYGIDGIGNNKTAVSLLNSFVNVHSAGLAANFNFEIGSISMWAKVSSAAIWTDGARHRMISLSADGNNGISIFKDSINNRITAEIARGGTYNIFSATDVNSTDWVNYTITWNKAQNRSRLYVGGIRSGGVMGGVHAGALANTFSVIGAYNTSGTQPWSGGVSNVMILTKELTNEEVVSINNGYNLLSAGRVGTEARVLIQFDDALSTQYSEAFSYMKAQGLKGTIYAITGLLGTAGYMTSAQCQEIYAEGWDIGNHTETNVQLTTLNLAQQQTTLSNAATALDGLGLVRASLHVAYPGAANDANTATAMAAIGALTGRLAEQIASYGFNLFTYPVTNKYQLRSVLFDRNTPFVTAKLYIDSAIKYNKVLIIFFHAVNNNPGLYDISTELFRKIIDYIKSTGVICQTISELYPDL